MVDRSADEWVLAAGRQRWVPHNRWDLVVDEVHERIRSPDATVAVVVPYFEQPQSLQRMYAALTLAGLDRRRHEVVVVDDGSRHEPPPPPPDLDVPVRRLRQPDRGCRPGAARNLGVGATTADVLVFLDADTLPCPSTIRRLAAWPDVLPDALVVGRRHHADLTGWGTSDVEAWLGGRRSDPLRRADPAWLEDGYAESRDLIDADDRAYRYVISGVMSCGRALFDDIGGFDAERAEYGGEDWELAFRAFNDGAVLVHDRRAIAWHDEPDRAERDGSAIDQTAETMWLATRIPAPGSRPAAVTYEVADTVAVVELGDADVGSLVTTVACVIEALGDVAVHIVGPTPPLVHEHFRFDRRVRFCPPAPDQQRRARAAVTIRRPVHDAATVGGLLGRVRPGGVATVHVTCGAEEIITVTSTRAMGRLRRARALGAPIDALVEALGEEWLEADAGGRT